MVYRSAKLQSVPVFCNDLRLALQGQKLLSNEIEKLFRKMKYQITAMILGPTKFVYLVVYIYRVSSWTDVIEHLSF